MSDIVEQLRWGCVFKDEAWERGVDVDQTDRILRQAAAEITRLRSYLASRESEILRLRTTETAAAHALDGLRQFFGLDLMPGEHPAKTRERIEQAHHDRVSEFNDEVLRLGVIVDKLPKTADGVPVVPGNVYFLSWEKGFARGVASVDASGPELVATVSVMSTLHGHTCKVQVLAEDCYSTREAAEEALRRAASGHPI